MLFISERMRHLQGNSEGKFHRQEYGSIQSVSLLPSITIYNGIYHGINGNNQNFIRTSRDFYENIVIRISEIIKIIYFYCSQRKVPKVRKLHK